MTGKKMFEIMADLKPVHVFQLPQNQVPALSLGPWKAEIETLITVLENRTGRQITPEKISAAIRLVNRERQAKKRLMEITRAKPSPLMGMELVENLFKTGFNPGRMEMLGEMIPGFSIDGVVDLTWQACHTYNVESFQLAKLVQDNFGLPFLHIETDYSESDTEQLRVRIQAFIEMI